MTGTIRVQEFEEALVTMDRVKAQSIFREVDAESGPVSRIEDLIVPALERIGQGWAAGQLSLSQVYMASRLSENLVDVALPPADPKRRRNPAMAIAVLEDYHLLGARIVYSTLRASGYELRNYGRVTVDEVLRHIIGDSVEVILLSVLMLPSALKIAEVTSRLRSEGQSTKVIVGGAPFRFDAGLAEEIGADAVGHTASDAVSIVRAYSEVVG